jgi:hypothetical protein
MKREDSIENRYDFSGNKKNSFTLLNDSSINELNNPYQIYVPGSLAEARKEFLNNKNTIPSKNDSVPELLKNQNSVFDYIQQNMPNSLSLPNKEEIENSSNCYILPNSNINQNNYQAPKILSKDSFKVIDNRKHEIQKRNSISKDEFLCWKCLSTFKEKELLDNHDLICLLEENKEEPEQHTVKKEEFLCIKCGTSFSEGNKYDMHYQHCEGKSWDNFGRKINPRNNENIRSDSFENYDARYVRSLSRGSSERSRSIERSIEIDDDHMNYEDLIRLDETVNHPLPHSCIIQLQEEVLKAEQINYMTEDHKRCLICFDDFQEENHIIRLPCLHFFHARELFKWFEQNKTCPVCRIDIQKELEK